LTLEGVLDTAWLLCSWLFYLAVVVAGLLTWGLVVRWLGAAARLADLQAEALEAALNRDKTKPPG